MSRGEWMNFKISSVTLWTMDTLQPDDEGHFEITGDGWMDGSVESDREESLLPRIKELNGQVSAHWKLDGTEKTGWDEKNTKRGWRKKATKFD